MEDDLDGDLMDDPWEVANGLDPTRGSDSRLDGDKDGYENWEEFEAQTDPWNPTDYPGHPGDLAPPTVTSTDPVNGSSGAAVDTNILVNFNEVLDTRDFTQASITIDPSVTFTYAFDTNNQILTIDPSSDLAFGTTYTVTIGPDLKDLGWNVFAGYQFSFTTTTSVSANESKFTIPASTGGTVILGDAKITVPAGALSADTEISISKSTVAQGDVALSDGRTIVSDYYDFGPAGTQFSTPVTIILPFDPSLIPSGVQEADLKAYLYANGNWVEVTGGVVDETSNTISFQVDHFSRYAVLSPSAVEAHPDNPTDYLGMLGYVGPIPTLVLLLVVILIVVLAALTLNARSKAKAAGSQPPGQQYQQQPQQQYRQPSPQQQYQQPSTQQQYPQQPPQRPPAPPPQQPPQQPPTQPLQQQPPPAQPAPPPVQPQQQAPAPAQPAPEPSEPEPPGQETPPPEKSAEDRLAELKALKEKGLITDDIYNEKLKEITKDL